MSIEIQATYDNFFMDGGLFGIVFIAMILFAAQAVFAFLLWRKGEDKFFLRFIIYSVVTWMLFMGVLGLGQYFAEDPGYEFLIGVIYLISITAPIVVGVTIFLFIWDTWIKTEEKA